MKPYLVEYLRSRDLHAYDCLLRQLTRPSPYACKRIMRTTVEILMPLLVSQWTPSLTEAELRRIALDRIEATGFPEEYPGEPEIDPSVYDNDDGRD